MRAAPRHDGPLAGGFVQGDRVVHQGMRAIVVGPPARAAAGRVSVGLRYENGEAADARVAELGQDAGTWGRDAGPDPSEYSIQPQSMDDPYGRLVDAESEPRQAQYGIGNRSLPDRHYSKPLGGEIEADYGIGNRHLEEELEPDPRGQVRRGALRGEMDSDMPRAGNFQEEALGDGIRTLEGLAEVLGDLEADVQSIYQQGREGTIAAGEARSALVNIETQAKQVEVRVDSIPISSMPPARAAEVKDFKGEILARLDSLFACLDDLFQQLPPPPAASTPPPENYPGRAPPAEDSPDTRSHASTVASRLAPNAQGVATLRNIYPEPPRSAQSNGRSPTQSMPFERTAPSEDSPARSLTSGLSRTTAPDPRARTPGEPLAGGFQKGDRVTWNGKAATVVGRPARAACAAISVAVRDDMGSITDVRIANLTLL